MKVFNVQSLAPGLFSSNGKIKKGSDTALNIPSFVCNFMQAGVGFCYEGDPEFSIGDLLPWEEYLVVAKPTLSGDGFVDITLVKRTDYVGDDASIPQRHIGYVSTNGDKHVVEDSIATINSSQFTDVDNILRKAGLYSSEFNGNHKSRGQYFDENAVFANNVKDKDLVYRDYDNVYKLAVADNTKKSKVVGVADRILNNKGFVIFSGLYLINETYVSGTKLYLSSTDPGKFTEIKTYVYIADAINDRGLIRLRSVEDSTKYGTVTQKQALYEDMLGRTSFYQMFLKEFKKNPTEDDELTLSGTNTPKFYANEEVLDGVTDSHVIFNVCNEEISFDRFYVHVEADKQEYKLFYSRNNEDMWTEISDKRKIIVFNRFKNLRVKLVWTSAFKVSSFAVFYDERFEAFATDNQFRKVFELDVNTDLPATVMLPGYTVFTKDGNSLDVYWNGLKLYYNIHYTEGEDKRSILIKKLPVATIKISAGDVFEFQQRYGYVDISTENFGRYIKEHSEEGHHMIPDIETGGYYRLVFENSKLKAIPVERDRDAITFELKDLAKTVYDDIQQKLTEYNAKVEEVKALEEKVKTLEETEIRHNEALEARISALEASQ